MDLLRFFFGATSMLSIVFPVAKLLVRTQRCCGCKRRSAAHSTGMHRRRRRARSKAIHKQECLTSFYRKLLLFVSVVSALAGAEKDDFQTTLLKIDWWYVAILAVCVILLASVVMYIKHRASRAGYESLEDVGLTVARREQAIAIVAVGLHVVDAALDVAMAVQYYISEYYGFCVLQCFILVASACALYAFKRVTWKPAEWSVVGSPEYLLFASGKNNEGEQKPSLRHAGLYVLQIMPVINAHKVIRTGEMTRSMKTDKAFAGTFEGFPAALLQTYIILITGEVSVLTIVSILSSLNSIAEAVDLLYLELLPDESVEIPPAILGVPGLRVWRVADVASRIWFLAIFGAFARPAGSTMHQNKQWGLFVILAFDVAVVFVLLKLTLSVKIRDLLRPELFLTAATSYMGMPLLVITFLWPPPVAFQQAHLFWRSGTASGVLGCAYWRWGVRVLDDHVLLTFISLATCAHVFSSVITILDRTTCWKYGCQFLPVLESQGKKVEHWAAQLNQVSLLQDAVASQLQGASIDLGDISEDLETRLGNRLLVKDAAGRQPIHYACAAGNIDALKVLGSLGLACLTATCAAGFTPVHYATKNGHAAVVRCLHELGAPLTEKTNIGFTPAHLAAEKGHEAVVRCLHELGAPLTEKTNAGFTPAHLAAQNGHEAVVRCLHELGAPLTEKSTKGHTPAHLAAQNGHEAVVRCLQELGVPLTEKINAGHTPAHLAAENGHEAVVRYLHELGAPLTEKTNNGFTPAHLAAEYGHEAVVRCLHELGAPLTEKINAGHTPAHIAAEKGHEAVVRCLHELGAPLTEKINAGFTPAHLAAVYGHEAVVRCLHKLGEPLTEKINAGFTPAHLAAVYGHEAVVRCLHKLGVPLTEKINAGHTPAHLAAQNGHEAVVRCLHELGAPLTEKSINGHTPAHLAAENGHDAVVRCLHELGAPLTEKTSEGSTPDHLAA